MGFQYAGNLGGAGAPIIRRFQTGEDLYIGQLVTTGRIGGTGGHVQLLDASGEAFDDDLPILGFVTAVADESRTYVASATDHEYGDKSTYTDTMSTITANQGTGLTGGGEVDVCLALQMQTLIRAPLYDTTWGTALTEIVAQSAHAGTVVTAASALADIADNMGTLYCRSGANRGQYRVITDITSTAYTVTVDFPYAIVAGDKFVAASCVLGLGGMEPTTYMDAIDGDNDMNYYQSVYYHEINLEESGKEYAIFSVWPTPVTSLS